MLQPNGYPQAQKYNFLLKGIIYALVVLYLANCFTPLRLHVDMLRYFAIMDCIQLGCSPDSAAAQDYLPYGYTALLLALSKTGLLNSFVIVLINCVYLFGSLYMVRKLFEAGFHSLFFLLLVLLNWTTIKFVTHPLSEMQYLFFSTGSLYFFYRYTKNKHLLSLALAFASGVIAFLTRSVGIALAAALVTSLVWQYRKELLLLIQRNKILVAVIAAIIITVTLFYKQLGLYHYTGVFTKQFTEGVGFADILKWHFTEWAELGFNTSADKMMHYLPSSISKIFFVLAGFLFFAGFVYILFFRKNNIPFIIKAYLFFYIILMFNWPFYDPRFWLPVLPLIIAVIVQSPFIKTKLVRALLFLLLAVYLILGILSVGYMTYTSLDKKVMARKQANGVYRNEYETLFFGKPQSDTANHTDPVILHVLERFNK